jgi:LacI family transcriptional regulator
MKNISLKDIAQKAGTSISTVSFVLNGKDKKVRISTALAAKIKSIAEKEGYYPNKMAVGLRTGKSNIIGLVVDTIYGHFFASLAEVIEKEMDQHGYKVIYCSTNNNAAKGKDLVRLLYQHQVDGYFIIPTTGMEKEIQGLEDQGKPVVLIDTYFPQIKSAHVLVDNHDGISLATSHLLKAGYDKIAFVYNDVAMIQMKERRRGFTEAMQLSGKKASMLKIPVSKTRQEHTEAIANFLKKQQPNAVIFAANYLGLRGLEAIRTLGLDIPNDLGVVCFDDHELFQLYQPSITVVQQPVQEMAKAAVNILMSKLKTGNTIIKDTMEIKAKLIRRESSRRVKRI